MNAYWASVLGPIAEPAENVNHNGYVLCGGCSRGHGAPHTLPCMCDLCSEDEP